MSLERAQPKAEAGSSRIWERLAHPAALLDARGRLVGAAERFPGSLRGAPAAPGSDFIEWVVAGQRSAFRLFLQQFGGPPRGREGNGRGTPAPAPRDLELCGPAAAGGFRLVPLLDTGDEARVLVLALAEPCADAKASGADRERQHRLRFSALLEAGRTLSSTLERDVILQRIVELVREVVVVPEVVLFLVGSDRQTLLPVVAKVDDFYDEVMALRVPIGRGIVGHVAQSGRAEIVNHAENDPRSIQVPGTPVEATSLLVVPLFIKDELTGVLALTRFGDEDFEADELEVVTIFGSQCSVAIENSRLYEDLRRTVDELRATQDQLIQSAKLNALGEMAGGVAHDFNNVLTAILGRTQLLLRWVRDTQLRESLRVIERTALDGAQTVRRIQEFTRVRHDHGIEAVDPNEVVRDVVELTRPSWEYPNELQGIRVTTALDLRATRCVRGRAAELREVLTNLVLNALDAMPDGGEIRLTTEDDGEFVVVRVFDTGIGMDAPTRSRIFDPFFTTKAQKGTGLGLSVAYGIVARHDGRIAVESEPGRGTTFTLTFPVCLDEAAGQPLHEYEGEMAPMRVLCVDDEKPVLEVMGELLEALGQEVETALGGVSGIEAAKRSRPDVVFTDLGMPVANGWEVASEVKKHSPQTLVVMVTGWGVQLEPESAFERGVDYILPKPYTLDEVKRILADISERRRAA